ncbi:MAG: MFS transporter, partial [Alphaproteobacteria bacterium]
LINSVAMVAMLLPILPVARLADIIGRRKVLMGAIVAMLLAIYPAFQMMQSGDFLDVLIAQSILGFILGCYLAPVPALLVELFPTRIRYTGMSLSYNFCAILGGFTPSVAEYLIRDTGDKTSIMYLFVFASVTSFIALYLYKDRWREALS